VRDPRTQLSLTLKPALRSFAGWVAQGFQYQWHYRSPTLPVYRLLDRATWEIDGAARGCAFWMRHPAARTIRNVHSIDDVWSTAWRDPGSVNPDVFQFLPFQTELQGFTFTASSQGVLITWATRVRHIRSLFEKPAGEDRLVHLHEHCCDLLHDVETAPMEVLWVPGRFDHVQLANLYEEVRETIADHLHDEIGMRRERVGTYALLEEWGRPDLSTYANVAVPALAEAGAVTIGLANLFRNNMNVWGVSNMCCTADWAFPADDAPLIREIGLATTRHDASLEMWGNTAISSLAYMMSRPSGDASLDANRFHSPLVDALLVAGTDPFVLDASGAPDADHYTPLFMCLNLRSQEVRRLWLDRWRAVMERFGITGIFLDSSFNLSSDKFHFRRRDGEHGSVLSQYLAHLTLIVQMQRMGFTYANEDIGVFGIHRHGPRLRDRLDALHVWPECLANFEPADVESAGLDADDVFFRGLAYRMVWMLHWNTSQQCVSLSPNECALIVPTKGQLDMLRIFRTVGSQMRKRTILPGGNAVVYNGDDGAQVFWSFASETVHLSSHSRVHDLMSGQTHESATIDAKPRNVYLVEPRHRSKPLTSASTTISV